MDEDLMKEEIGAETEFMALIGSYRGKKEAMAE